jgi:hypothetical protein
MAQHSSSRRNKPSHSNKIKNGNFLCRDKGSFQNAWGFEDAHQYDIDKELLRRLVNYKVSKMKWVVNGKTWTNLGLSATTFDMCIAEVEKKGFLR